MIVVSVVSRNLNHYFVLRFFASPCGICGGQFDAKTCFRPHRTSVFPLIVVPPVLQTMLLLTEGRAGEVWESSNKQCPVGYRRALDAEVFSHCSFYPVSACCLLVSSLSLVPFYHCNIPFYACHPYHCFSDTSALHSHLDTVLTVSSIVWHV